MVFCKAFPLKKMLPLDRVFDKENICMKKDYVSCPLYREKMVGDQPQSRICHYLGTENIVYCRLSPVKRMIPVYSLKFEGPCSNGTYESCPSYRKMLEGDQDIVDVRSGFDEITAHAAQER